MSNLDKHPDLRQRMDFELSQLRGCAKCKRGAILRKYTDLAESRERDKVLALETQKRYVNPHERARNTR